MAHDRSGCTADSDDYTGFVRRKDQPIGILYARDILQALLAQAEDHESLLRDYVMGVGYH